MHNNIPNVHYHLTTFAKMGHPNLHSEFENSEFKNSEFENSEFENSEFKNTEFV